MRGRRRESEKETKLHRVRDREKQRETMRKIHRETERDTEAYGDTQKTHTQRNTDSDKE